MVKTVNRWFSNASLSRLYTGKLIWFFDHKLHFNTFFPFISSSIFAGILFDFPSGKQEKNTPRQRSNNTSRLQRGLWGKRFVTANYKKKITFIQKV